MEIDEVLVVLVLLELEVEELVLDEPQVQGCAGSLYKSLAFLFSLVTFEILCACSLLKFPWYAYMFAAFWAANP